MIMHAMMMTRCYRYAAGDGIMATYTASHLAPSGRGLQRRRRHALCVPDFMRVVIYLYIFPGYVLVSWFRVALKSLVTPSIGERHKDESAVRAVYTALTGNEPDIPLSPIGRKTIQYRLSLSLSLSL